MLGGNGGFVCADRSDSLGIEVVVALEAIVAEVILVALEGVVELEAVVAVLLVEMW